MNVYNINIKLNEIDNTLSKLSYKYLSTLRSGYFNINDIKYKINKLLTYRNIVKRYNYSNIYNLNCCLSDNEINCILEKISNIIGSNCDEKLNKLIKDDDKMDEWVINYPHCISYEKWEKWSKFFCGNLNLTLTLNKKKSSNLLFEISRGIINPNLLLGISSYKEVNNNLNLKVNRTDDEIKLDFNLLLEKVDSLDLDLKTYKKIVKDYNLSYDMVKNIYDNNVKINIDGDVLLLKTPLDSYNINDISGDINIKYLENFNMKTTINKKDLIQDYK